MEKYTAKRENLDLCQVLLLFFAYQHLQGLQKLGVDDLITIIVKKKTCAEFCRYEKSTLYKVFLYNFSTKCTNLVCDFY